MGGACLDSYHWGRRRSSRLSLATSWASPHLVSKIQNKQTLAPYSLVSKVQPSMHEALGHSAPNPLVMPVFGKRRGEKDEEFKVILGYTVSSKPLGYMRQYPPKKTTNEMENSHLQINTRADVLQPTLSTSPAGGTGRVGDSQSTCPALTPHAEPKSPRVVRLVVPTVPKHPRLGKATGSREVTGVSPAGMA